jgi:hypothetical protein
MPRPTHTWLGAAGSAGWFRPGTGRNSRSSPISRDTPCVRPDARVSVFTVGVGRFASRAHSTMNAVQMLPESHMPTDGRCHQRSAAIPAKSRS